jgi:hypothetical protein
MEKLSILVANTPETDFTEIKYKKDIFYDTFINRMRRAADKASIFLDDLFTL